MSVFTSSLTTLCFSDPTPVTVEKKSSPVEAEPPKAAKKTEEIDIIDMKEHVNVVFIGHVGMFTISYSN